MEGLTCDRCGKALLVTEQHRYVMDITIVAPYDVLEITADELHAMDPERALAEAIEEVSKRDPEDLAAEVYERLHFDLCPACRRAFRADPLGRAARAGEAGGGGMAS